MENIAKNELKLILVKQRVKASGTGEQEFVNGTPAAFTGQHRRAAEFNGMCLNCGRRGHLKEDCGRQNRSKIKHLNKQSVSFSADKETFARKKRKIVFKLDSSCSIHMVSDEDFSPT